MSFSFHQLSKKIQNRDNHHEHRSGKLYEARLLDDARGEINTHGEERPQKACQSDGNEKPNPERQKKHTHQPEKEGIEGCEDRKQQQVLVGAQRVHRLAFQRTDGVDKKLHCHHEHHGKDHILGYIGEEMRHQAAYAIAHQSQNALAKAKHDGNPNLLRRFVVGLHQAHRACDHAGGQAEDEKDA